MIIDIESYCETISPSIRFVTVMNAVSGIGIFIGLVVEFVVVGAAVATVDLTLGNFRMIVSLAILGYVLALVGMAIVTIAAYR